MADDDQQWPSEDEDFDAVHSDDPTATDDNFDNESQDDTSSDSQATNVPVTSDEDTPAESESTAEAPSEETDSTDNQSADTGNEAEEAPYEEPAETEVAPEAPAEATVEPAQFVESEAMPESDAPVNVSAAPTKKKMPKLGKKSGFSLRTLFEAVLIIVLVLLALGYWKEYNDNKDLKQQNATLNNNPQIAVQKQTSALINNVSKLIQLPSGETPTIANVTDASQAKQQSAFFKNAENGDKVLMYVKAGEAILYRPSTNKIILVAPLTFSNNTSSSSTAK